MNKKIQALENKIQNSQHKITRNFWYYAIAPFVVLLVGVILLCTVGFNGGTQLKGGSTVTVYVNNGGEFTAPSVQYDIDKNYNEICNQISSVLANGNLKVESFQKTQIDIENVVAGGDAVKVVFLNSSKDEAQIKLENDTLKTKLANYFGYAENSGAITDVERFEAKMTLNFTLMLIASIIFAVTLALVYLALRSRSASWLTGLLFVVLDMAIVGSLLLICRVPVSTAIAATLITTAVVSGMNVLSFFGSVKTNIDNTKFAKMKPCEMADTTAKNMLVKKAALYIGFILIALLLVVWGIAPLTEVALGLLLGGVSTFYTSSALLPALWAVAYKPSKKLDRNKKEA